MTARSSLGLLVRRSVRICAAVVLVGAVFIPGVTSFRISSAGALEPATITLSTPVVGESPTLTFRYQLSTELAGGSNILYVLKPASYSNFTASTDQTFVQALTLNGQPAGVTDWLTPNAV